MSMTTGTTRLTDALLSGLAGAVALTAVHETARRLIADAPRVDTLGRRAIARGLEGVGVDPPSGDTLQAAALGGDLASNALYYGLVGLGTAAGAVPRGLGLGAAMGLAAVALPPALGLGKTPAAGTPRTAALTVAWYVLGGLAAAATYQALSARRQSR